MAGMKAGQQDWICLAGRLAEACPKNRLHPAVLARTEGVRSRRPWVVGFSGGADSLALLLLLWAHWPAARGRLQAVHFNHRLRGAAADCDEGFCRTVCAGLGVTFLAGRRRRGQALRNAAEARVARFAFIEARMKALRAKELWLGHQQNDIAESMLMRLARGSGTGGLAAPRPVQVMPAGRVHLRPLLTLKHTELVAFLRAVKAPWCEDATNATDIHFRNRIRGAVLPAWSRASDRDVLAGAARSRELLEEDDGALEAWVDALDPLTAGGMLDVRKLGAIPRAVTRRALRRWLVRQSGAGELSRQAFDALLDATVAGRATRHSIGINGFAVIRTGLLRFEPARPKRRKLQGGL